MKFDFKKNTRGWGGTFITAGLIVLSLVVFVMPRGVFGAGITGGGLAGAGSGPGASTAGTQITGAGSGPGASTPGTQTTGLGRGPGVSTPGTQTIGTASTNNSSNPFYVDWAIGALIKLISLALYVIQTVIAGLLGIAGLLLDKVISLSVVDLAKNINALTGVNVAWRLIRDLCNMSFIFVLLYYAIRMIFGLGDQAKKVLVSIIIAAVLINFSLFFTKIIIDASNVVASSFYNSITTIPQTTLSTNSTVDVNGKPTTTSTQYTFGLSGALMKDLTLTSLFTADTASVGQNPQQYILSLVGNSLFMLVTTFLFLFMAALFMIRYLLFIFLLIISPLGIVSGAIPGLAKISKQYWDTLIGQALFAPIFMIMMWIVLTLLDPANGWLSTAVGSNGLGSAIANPSAGSVGIIVNYCLITGFLILIIIVSKSYATEGGLASGKIVTAGTALVGGAVFGGAAAVGRRTIGARANAIAEDQDLKDKAARGDRVAQAKLASARYVAGSSFDARRGAISEGILGTAGINLGKGNLIGKGADKGGGFAQTKKDKLEKEKKYAESLKPTDEAEEAAKTKLATDTTFSTEEKKKIDDKLAPTQAAYDTNKAAAEAEKKLAENEKIKAEKDKERLVRENKALDIEIERLEKEKVKEKNVAVKAVIQGEIDANETLKATAEGALRAATDVANKKVELFKETEKKIADIEKARKIEREEAMSEELKSVIKTAGGSKANKDILKARFGLEGMETELSDAKIANMNAYARALETKSTWTRAWGIIPGIKGTPKINKQAAVAVRRGIKGKSLNDLIAEKAIADAAAAGATPPATPTPTPPPTPGTPTP